MRREFKTRTVTLRMPWTGQDRPTNRQVASWLHSFVEDPRRDLLPDPGHGAGHRCSYRLEAIEIKMGLGASGSETPSELLRRVIHTYLVQQGAPAPVSHPAPQAAITPASNLIPAKRLPQASSRVYPTDGRKVEIAVEDVHEELKKLGYREMPQPTSRYFRQGKKIIREEGGAVLKVYEGPE